MGFKDVMNFEIKKDPISGGARPHLPPEERQRLMRMQDEMKQDLDDPDFHFDTLGDPYNENEDLDRPRNE